MHAYEFAGDKIKQPSGHCNYFSARLFGYNQTNLCDRGASNSMFDSL